jgi:hypothetical protein
MATWTDALKAEIDGKKLELGKLQDIIAQAKSLMMEVSHLESIYASATGVTPVKAAKATGRKGRTWTEEQKKEASEKRLAKNAAKGIVARPKKA